MIYGILFALSIFLMVCAGLFLIGVAISGHKSLKPPHSQRDVKITMNLAKAHFACVGVGTVLFFLSKVHR